MSHTKRIQHKISQADLQVCLSSWLKEHMGSRTKENVLKELKSLKRHLTQMRERGGYVMVSVEGVDVTVYGIN